METMNSFIIYLLMMVFTFLFFSTIAYYEQREQVNTIQYKTLNNSYNQLNRNYDVLLKSDNELYDKYSVLIKNKGNKKLNQLLNLMDDIHNRYNYTEDFRCLNFSRIMKEEAEGLGFNNTIVYGQMKDTDNYTSHAWNRFVLDIDSTWGYWDIDREVFDFKGEWIERDEE